MKVQLFSAEKQVFSGEVEALYSRSPQGWFGILPGHSPAVFQLSQAPLRLITPAGERVFQVKEGLIQVRRDAVVVMADEVRKGA